MKNRGGWEQRAVAYPATCSASAEDGMPPGLSGWRLQRESACQDGVSVRPATQQLLTETYSLIPIQSRHARTGVERGGQTATVRVARGFLQKAPFNIAKAPLNVARLMRCVYGICR